ncbi:putative serine protease K12H4.7 [Planococcus citri]|uniref:putative serine protease K12H4.7 n=1 Tax=Planococcus citri TaxID=170843 RepID=UPI0031F96D88
MIFLKTLSLITWVLFLSNFAFSSAFFHHEQLYRQRWLEQHISKTNLRYESSTEYTFQQKLDHFDPTNEETWLQRYWVDSTFYQKGGPAFLVIDGETQADVTLYDKTEWKNYARNFNATFFYLEHRFYGRSVPKNDTSTQNLVYLSSQQALADIANFICGVTNQYNLSTDTKWIVFGCSYAGSLAAWARLKYPNLVHGAVSSSAPLVAKEAFTEYYPVVKESLDYYKPTCSAKVAEANKHLSLLIQRDQGRRQVQELFGLCCNVDYNMESVSTLFGAVLQYIVKAVQYNLKQDIEDFCNIMTISYNASTLQLYAKAIKAIRFELEKGNRTCLNNCYRNDTDNLTSTNRDPVDNRRQWLYQICTEFGWFPTTNKSTSDSLGAYIPVEYFIKQCEKTFGPKNTVHRFNGLYLKRVVNETNTFYGGLKINVGNTVLIHGSIDPWHSIGITRAEIPNAPYKTIYINGSGHCGEIFPPKSSDSEEVRKAQEEIANTLQSWLQN